MKKTKIIAALILTILFSILGDLYSKPFFPDFWLVISEPIKQEVTDEQGILYACNLLAGSYPFIGFPFNFLVVTNDSILLDGIAGTNFKIFSSDYCGPTTYINPIALVINFVIFLIVVAGVLALRKTKKNLQN